MSGMRGTQGFTLVELLLAAAIAVTVSGAVLAIVAPSQGVFQAQPDRADMQQRLRVAVSTLRGRLLMAGAGTTTTWPARGPLVRAFAPVMPYRAGAERSDPAAGIFYRADAITIVYAPPTPAQATVLDATAAGGALAIEAAPNCGATRPDRVCGFAGGMHVALVDQSGAWNLAVISSLAGATLQLQPAGVLMSSYDSGEAVVAEAEWHTYYLKRDVRAGAFQLMHYDGRQTDLPVVDDVVSLLFEYAGEPLPPALLPGVEPGEVPGPWTTYGPKPPPLGVDNAADAWGPGENCTFTVLDGAHAPRLPALAAPGTLVPLPPSMLVDGPWCPDAFAAGRYDADLLRVRRVHVVMRVQAAQPWLRGPAGRFFAHGGTARSGDWIVPDQEIRFDVTPRNLASGR